MVSNRTSAKWKTTFNLKFIKKTTNIFHHFFAFLCVLVYMYFLEYDKATFLQMKIDCIGHKIFIYHDTAHFL